MACNNEINTSGAIEERIIAMARVDFDFSALFFLDDAQTVEDTLVSSKFDMVVRDKAGLQILVLSTEGVEPKLTIDNYNELLFFVPKEEMDIAPGAYKYNLQRTVDEITFPVMLGDFIVQPNTNPADVGG